MNFLLTFLHGIVRANKPDSVFDNDLSMPETLSPIPQRELGTGPFCGEIRQLQQGGLPSSK